MASRWLALAVLCLTARCTVSADDQLLSVVTWAVQQITEPMLGRQANQQARLDMLGERVENVAWLLSNLTDRQTRLEVRSDQQGVLEQQVFSRLGQLERLFLLPTSGVAACGNSAAMPSGLRDCSDLPFGSKSGIHLLWPGLDGSRPPVPAYCDQDMDGGGWTVFQRRVDIEPRLDFFLHWAAYRAGFGELDMEFWWGLEHLFTATSSRDRRYELRIDMEDYEGEWRHAVYQGFRISSEEDGYRLQAANYSGDAGDSLSEHIGMRFSTRDRDQDEYHTNCANTRMGAWWYNRCYHSNLNGRHFTGEFRRGQHGTSWRTWRGGLYSLKTVEMKFRPTMKTV